MFVIVDPVASGASLSAAFAEQGWPCWHLYEPELREAWAADNSARVLLHKTFEETLQVVGELAPRGVIPGSEKGVALANELAAALGLPHNAPCLAAARQNTLEMTHVLETAGIAAASTELVRTEQQLEGLLSQPDIYPLVFRPAVPGGAVVLCTNVPESRRAFADLMHLARVSDAECPGVLVQEYLDGPQYLVSTVSRAGEHLVTEVYSERVDEVNRVPVRRHSLLLRELDSVDQAVISYVRSCLDALGIHHGPAHCRVRVTSLGPMLIGAHPWLMDSVLPADTYVPGLGYSQATVLAESYLDPMSFARRLRGPYQPQRVVCRVQLRMHRSGVVRDMKGLDVLRRLPGFHSLAQTPALGAWVKDALLTAGAGGLAHFVHEDAAVLRNSLRQVHDLEDRGRLYLITGRSALSFT